MPRTRPTPPPRIIPVTGEVAYDTVLAVQALLLEYQKTPGDIVVRITSPGGDVGAGFAIHDLLRASPRPTVTEAWGECSSIALVILMAGDERRASPYTRFLIHNAHASVEGEKTEKDLKRNARAMSAINDLYNQCIAKRIGVPVEQVAKWAGRETHFGAAEALNMKVIDRIIQ